MKPKVTSEEVLYSGKFLDYQSINWIDKNGKDSKWESISRKDNTEAVSIVPILVPSMKYVIIKQYRPTVDNYVLTFPAGLVDKGDSYQDCALRELKEETGYIGYVVKLSPPTLSSAGMTDELVSIAVVHIDERDNQNPQQELEDSEDIEVILVGENEIKKFLHIEVNNGTVLSGRFASYLMGRNLV